MHSCCQSSPYAADDMFSNKNILVLTFKSELDPHAYVAIFCAQQKSKE